MGLIDREVAADERPPDSPAWDSLSAARRSASTTSWPSTPPRCIASTAHRHAGGGLKQRGVLDNTLILFMSDNGGNAESGPAGRLEGEPPGGPDSNVFLGHELGDARQHALPPLQALHARRRRRHAADRALARRHSRRAQGKFEHQPGHLVDIMPTVVDAAGAKYPASLHGKTTIPMEGVSLVPGVRRQALERKQPIFFMHEGNRAVRDGKWKLVSKYKEPWELYDMEADRTEMHNLAAERPEVVARLEAAYDAWAKSSYAEPWKGPRRTDWEQKHETHEAGESRVGKRPAS